MGYTYRSSIFNKKSKQADFYLQFQSGLPVTSRSGAILKTTVVREKWELNNDDIELVRAMT